MSDSRRGPTPPSTSNTHFHVVLAALCHVWDVALKPVPKLTSVDDVDGTFFFAPLAYLAATLVTALYFSQVWLFTLSAFGVVWLDSQMAWRAQKIGMEIMQRHIAEQAEAARTTASRQRLPVIDEEPRTATETPVEAEQVTVAPVVIAEPELSIEKIEEVVSVPEIEVEEVVAVPEVSLPAEVEAPVLAAIEEEKEAPLYDDTFTLMAEMEAVHRELAQVLGARKQALQQAASAAAMATATCGPPPQLPPRPSPAETKLEVIPADEDTALHVFSMEELEESSSSQSSLRSFGEFIDSASASGPGQEFSRPPSRQINREAPHFPIIDDVLKEFEATMRAPTAGAVAEIEIEMMEMDSAESGSENGSDNYDHDSGHSSEHDDSRNGSSGDENESRPDSPATSVSSSNNDDDDVKEEPLDFVRPALEHVDSGICMEGDEYESREEDEEEAIVAQSPAEEKTIHTVCETELAVVEEEETVQALIEAIELPIPTLQRPKLIRASTSRSSQKKILPPRKNNGHKRIPKKVRLSTSEKQKFLSRPVW